MIDPAGAADLRTDRTIVVVDDDPLVIALVTEAFRTSPFRVIGAESTAACLAVLDVDRTEPAAILLDVFMPEGDAFDAMRALAHRQCRSPIFIVSAGPEDYLGVGLELGRAWGLNLVEALSKPLDVEQLRHKVEVLGAVAATNDAAARRSVILIVEDDELIRLVMAEVFADSGFEVLLATDGMDALDQLRRHSPIDLLCTDIDMPRMDGITLAVMVQKQFPDLNILFTSGKIDQTPLRHAHFIAKPWASESLVSAARSAMAG